MSACHMIFSVVPIFPSKAARRADRGQVLETEAGIMRGFTEYSNVHISFAISMSVLQL